MNQTSYPMGKKFIWVVFVLLFILHQDAWWWDEASLVLGFMPVGLAFHAGFSIACAILGWAAIKYAWPHELERFAEENNTEEKAN